MSGFLNLRQTQHLFIPIKMKRITLFFSVFFIIPFYHQLIGQSSDIIKFHSIPEGISNNLVSYITQDNQGFMWFGTASGINKFDGYQFTDPALQSEIASFMSRRVIRHIFQDSKGLIWICTEGTGLFRYDPIQQDFLHLIEGNGAMDLSYNIVNQTYEDKDGLIWIATGRGLDVYNPKTNKTRKYIAESNRNFITRAEFRSFVEDSQGDFWVATRKTGLVRFNQKQEEYSYFNTENLGLKDNNLEVIIPSKEKNKFWLAYEKYGIALVSTEQGNPKIIKQFSHDPDNPNSLPGNLIRALHEDSSGRLWIGTENTGLSIYDPKSNTFSNFQHNDQDEFSLRHNSVWSICEDSFGNIWIGTFNQGVNVVYNEYYNKFDHYLHKKGIDNSLVNNNVLSFLESSNQKVWISTDGGGISLWDRKSNTFNNFSTASPAPLKISNNAVLSICETTSGHVWFSTWEGGVNIYDPKNQRFSLMNTETHDISSNTHFSIIQANDGNMYMCSWRDHLDVFDPIQQKLLWSRDFTEYEIFALNSILEDKKGNLWIGSYDGVVLMDKANRSPDGEVQIFQYNEAQPSSLSDNAVHQIFEDSKGNIWIATAYGLNLYQPKSKGFKHYYKKDGLPNNNIRGIAEDLSGNLWVTTNEGLVKYVVDQNQFEYYDKEDGLQSNIFSKGSAKRLDSGEIIIGGSNGFNIFNPQKIPKNPYLPKVLFTGFKVFNKTIDSKSKDSPLDKSIEFTKEITLSYQQSTFTIEFVAINYTHTDENQYAYFLEGLDQEWNYIGHKKEANYTALPAGSYTFKVKAANNDGLWNDLETTLKINILPPWWATWWFRAMLLLGIITCIILGVQWRMRNIRAQNIKLENLVEERTKELQSKNEEVTQQAEELFQQAEELTSQRDFIQHQNKELSEKNKTVKEQNVRIQQSIKAAQIIQTAVLPHDNKIKHIFNQYFLINRPKDVVSGDFYWLKKLDQSSIIVVADCTGHGVPGAFMTLIGSMLLDKIIKEAQITCPAQILSQLHKDVFKVLSQKYNNVNNGMDAIVVSISPSEQTDFAIQFAGAKNSIYYTNYLNKKEVIEIKGTRRGIGGYQNEAISFENHKFSLPKGSRLYLGSDGFIDQNNFKRKKFGVARFKQLITTLDQVTIENQKEVFEKALNQHSIDTLQRDDILLFGIEL